MINNSLAAHGRATSVPGALETSRDPSTEFGIVSRYSGGSREMRPPIALWIYVARGVGRIILSVLSLPFV